MAADSANPFPPPGIRLLLQKPDPSSHPRSRSRSSPVSQPPLSHSNKRHHKRKHKSGRNTGKVPLHYLKPGALAQLRDARKNARISHPAALLPKKKRIGELSDMMDVASGPHDAAPGPASAVDNLTPVPPMTPFGPLCPQRKKLLAPKLFLPFPASFTARSPTTPTVVTSASPSESSSESLLESLPLELLVRIVCNLRHDELKPAFHVSRRVRQAVLIARQCHFDYTTPDRDRHDVIGTPLHRLLPSVSNGAQRPPTPRAPRQGNRPVHTRIPLADLQQLAMPILRGRSNNHRSTVPVPCAPVRGVASHRVLFYEDELCQAVAQNTL